MARTDADYERTRFLETILCNRGSAARNNFSFLLLQSNFVERHYGKVFVEVTIFAQMINQYQTLKISCLV